MDVLDKLKNDWQKNGDRYPRISEHEIYGMLHKKSSSIVKWILFISIIEFAVFLTLSLMLSDTQNAKTMVNYMGEVLNITFTVIDMGINVVFMYLFYINYKKIKNTDKVKNLMANILKSRKIVSRYIMVKLIATFILALISIQYVHTYDPKWIELFQEAEQEGKGFVINLLYYGVGIIAILLFVALFWLFYKLIYGLLLKRLNRNYQELKKIEI
ncbi:hypothetical protein [Flavobacterium beibuense]|uniref:Membrane protein n=1 Tax=Flavobacterium beibuense TaxID=657326 RepID=A0A444W8S8_9FLAO|nr:hypothetical protein [Flavobacterium beibuense]RYJ42315.1 Membrane protein [Flavobacterium beibuense]